MSRLTRFDAWLGLRVFHPPIIRFCQLTGYTQHKLHRDLWFAVALWVAWRANVDDRSWWVIGMLLFLCVIMGLRAAITPASFPGQTWSWFRLLILFWMLFSLPLTIALGEWDKWVDDLAILVAEYAATITTIPPRKRRESKALRRKEQHA